MPNNGYIETKEPEIRAVPDDIPIPHPLDFPFMELALREARKAARDGEVPVGAVVTDADGHLLGCGRNGVIGRADPTAHAEVLALRRAARRMGNYRLPGSTLYVTIEPCVMCMGAIVHARVERLVFGAPDPKWGACGSLYDLSRDARLNHRVRVFPGVMADVCAELMRSFFRERRQRPAGAGPISHI